MIRQAVEEDFDAICDLIRDSQKEQSNYSKMVPHEEIAKKSLEFWMENPYGIVWVLDDDGVQGIFAGAANPSWFFLGDVAQQLFWYVRPKYRGKGWLLVNAFTDWARKRPGVKQIVVGNSFSEDPRVDKLFKRLGFSQRNSNFSIEV